MDRIVWILKSFLGLRAQGIEVFIGHNAANLDGYDTVVYNAAIPRDNPEMVRARADGLRMIYRADFLTALMGEHKNAIGVAGMHGKSTTSAMLSHVFLSADRDPDILIGAQLPELNAAYRVGKTGTDFIFEACEYRDSFLSFRPTIAVVLNVEMDHPDYFKDMEQVRASFHKYLQIPGKSGHAVINADDENAMQCAKGIETPVTTFSLHPPPPIFTRQICTLHTAADDVTSCTTASTMPPSPFLYPGGTMWQTRLRSLPLLRCAA